MTLQLFDVLLHTPLPTITNTLILRYWEGQREGKEDEGIQRTRNGLIIATDELGAERLKLEETARSYLCLVPDHLRSCKSVSDDVGLEHYLVEAHQQVRG